MALKLVSLRSMFPDADILQMIEKRLEYTLPIHLFMQRASWRNTEHDVPHICPCRPTILQDEEFGQLQGNLEQLQNALPGADVLNLVAQQVRRSAS